MASYFKAPAREPVSPAERVTSQTKYENGISVLCKVINSIDGSGEDDTTITVLKRLLADGQDTVKIEQVNEMLMDIRGDLNHAYFLFTQAREKLYAEKR